MSGTAVLGFGRRYRNISGGREEKCNDRGADNVTIMGRAEHRTRNKDPSVWLEEQSEGSNQECISNVIQLSAAPSFLPTN